jgi:hypothetical protein
MPRWGNKMDRLAAMEAFVVVVDTGSSDSPGGSVIVMPDAFNAANRELIIALLAHYGVPAIYGNNFTELGGLIFYGTDFVESFQLSRPNALAVISPEIWINVARGPRL